MKLLVANWKMNLDLNSGAKLVTDLSTFIEQNDVKHKIIVCPAFTMLDRINNTVKDCKISLGAQGCFFAEKGAYTGEVSPAMLKDCGCDYVILGHSEPRLYYQEPLDTVQKKALMCHKYGITTIICIGESEQQRKQGLTFEVLKNQLLNSLPITSNCHNTIIAYEPIWAIGTGKNPSNEQIEEVNEFICNILLKNFSFENMPVILYGGSVNPNNCKDVLNVRSLGGLLIGGASLVYKDFTHIISNIL